MRLFVNLIVAICHPPLVLWTAHSGAPTVLTCAVLVAGVLLVADTGWLVAGMLASLLAVAGTISARDDEAVRERSVRASCAVLSVVKRDELRTHTTADGSIFVNTVTFHDHRLRCDGAPVDLLSWTSRVAEPGQRLEIVHDPLRQVGPVPASTVRDDGGTAHYLALILTGVAVVCRVGGVLRGEN
ncbi:hypothetical protein GCM10022247_38870 [Allokutzneria multivorans]|uniref:Uncharacterized protein n=1 Tax=Allokutzneria multivorans TaxID=1142134 RepID=A0ABP7SJA7_9PSEU